MTILRVDDFSVAITAFFLKLIGLWFARSSCERWLRNVTLCYTMGMIFFAVYIQTTLIYHSTDDFENCLFATLNLLSTTVPMFKILILLPRREKFFHLILHMVRNFFHANYDDYETLVLSNCKRKCSFFACTFVCFTELTIISYVFTSLIENMGKNETERSLPFKMWVNLPMEQTPYFEIGYIAQTLSLCSIGFAYLCIDNMLCIINLHLATQFRILQYRLADKYTAQDQNNVDQESKNYLYLTNNASHVFKSYIRQHQSLMQYCEEIEGVFSTVVLVQVLTFSMLICLDGYLILVAEMAQRKIMFVCHFAATVCQLVMFSYGCDCIIRESTKLATAAYSGPWLQLPPSKSVKEVKKDLIMLVMRSNIPCYLTGSGFFIASLETCTKVLTTAASYFTLLQKTENNISA